MKEICPVCGKRYSGRFTVQDHIYRKYKENEQRHFEYYKKQQNIKCPLCDFKSIRKTDISKHIINKKDKEHLEFYKKQCGLILKLGQKWGIKRINAQEQIFFGLGIIKNILKKKDVIKCPICNKEYRKEKGLKNHIRNQKDKRHREYFEKTYKVKECFICNCKFSNLSKHFESMWRKQDLLHFDFLAKKRQFECFVCKRRFTSKNSRSVHIQYQLDEQHRSYYKKNKERIIKYFNEGLCILEIQNKDDILSGRKEISNILRECGISNEEILKRKYDKTTGPSHFFWQGGISLYRGKDWGKQRKLAFNRDKGICQDCGAKIDIFKDGFFRNNSVHHKIPYRLTQDNSLDNLETLCNKCHKIKESKITKVIKTNKSKEEIIQQINSAFYNRQLSKVA